MSTLGIVPARGGSKGIPGKNLRTVGPRTLIEWTARSALPSRLDRVIVSTDSKEIANEAERAGLEVPFLRPGELATDASLTIDVVQHALSELGTSWDTVMILQPTSPFRNVEDIDRCLELFAHTKPDSVVSVTEVGDHHPARMKSIEDGFLIDPPFAEDVEGQPRQTLPKLYLRNGAIYLTATHVLLNGSIKGLRSLAYVMPEERSLNIDNEFDLRIADAVARTNEPT